MTGHFGFYDKWKWFLFSAESYDDYYDIKNIFRFKMMTLGPFHGGHHSGPG